MQVKPPAHKAKSLHIIPISSSSSQRLAQKPQCHKLKKRLLVCVLIHPVALKIHTTSMEELQLLLQSTVAMGKGGFHLLIPSTLHLHKAGMISVYAGVVTLL